MNLQDITICLLENTTSNIESVKKVAHTIRDKYIKLKGGSGVDLSGTCLDACNDLYKILTDLGYDIQIVDGYAIFNTNLDTSEITYDYHTACYIIINNIKYYLDVVADQFKYYISGLDDDIILQPKTPEWFVENEPTFSRTNMLENYHEDTIFDNDDIYTVTVYKVCMDTYSGKRLYLAQNDVSLMSWKDAKTYDWQFDPRGAMEFDTFEEAEEFAKKYFKHFDRWYIYETIGYR